MIERHASLQPDACEVCHYIQSHPGEALDVRFEHTRGWIAQSMLIYDLIEANGAALPP